MRSAITFLSGGTLCLAGMTGHEALAFSDALDCFAPPPQQMHQNGAPAAGGVLQIVGTLNANGCGTGADVWGDGIYAYRGHFGFSCVDVIDVSDPTNPTLVSTYSVPAPNQTCSAQDVKVHDGIGYIAYESNGNDGLGIVDFRDPFNPVELTRVRIDAGGIDYDDIHNIFFSNGFLFLASGRTNTIPIVDLRSYDPDAPPATITTAMWHLTNVGTINVHDITVLGDRMYVSAWSDTMIYDITDIANNPPVLLGSAPGTSAHANWATADEQYVVSTEERSGGGLKLYEVSNAADGGVNMTLLDEVNEGGAFSAHNPLIVGDVIYTSWYEAGLLAHRIDRNTGQLVEIGRVDPGTSWGVYPLLGLDRIILGGFDHLVIVEATILESEVICPDDPDNFFRQFGGPVTGDALDLCDSDDVRMEVLQSARLSPLLPFIQMEAWANSTFSADNIVEVKYLVEGHVSALVAGGQNADTLRTWIRNYNAGAFELIDFRGTSANTDETIMHTQTLNAQDYVNAGDGEVRIRMQVFDPGNVFSPNWFLKVDQYEVTVSG